MMFHQASGQEPLIARGSPSSSGKPCLFVAVFSLAALIMSSAALFGIACFGAPALTSEALQARRLNLIAEISKLSGELRLIDGALADVAWDRRNLTRPEMPNALTELTSILGDHVSPKDSGASIAAGVISGVVILYLCLAGCFRENEKHPAIPEPSTSSLNRPDVWEDRDVMDAYVQKGLEIEQYADLSCFGLMLNRPWLTSPGNKVEGLPVTSNKEWLGELPWPSGRAENPTRIWPLIWAFWTFLWRKKQPYWCMVLMVVEGLCAPLLAQVVGWIADEISNPSHDNGTWNLFCYSCLALFLNIVESRADYIYEIEVPGASVRYEFTMRLQRQFLGMTGEDAKAWPAGRCSAVLNYDIVQAVNLTWESTFAIAKCFTSLSMLAWITQRNLHPAFPEIRLAFTLMFGILVAGTYVNQRLRRSNVLDLAKRKRDWELAWTGLSVMQIRESREGTGRRPDVAAQELGDAAMVYRKRAFHYFFVRFVCALAPSEMTFMAQSAVMYVTGQQVMLEHMSVGEAVALIAVVKLGADQMTAWVTIHLNILEGYVSLLDIAEVFNMKVS